MIGRRIVLASFALPLTGCVGQSTPESDEQEPRSDWPDHSGSEPEEVPSDYRCDGVCGMTVSGFPLWNTQLAHVDGTGAFFCSLGCMLGYLFAPDHVGANTSDVENVWVRDIESRELTLVDDVVFVLETDEDAQQTGEPMGVNPRPFISEPAADTYIQERDHLDQHDVAHYDEFSRETALLYQAGRIPAD